MLVLLGVRKKSSFRNKAYFPGWTITVVAMYCLLETELVLSLGHFFFLVLSLLQMTPYSQHLCLCIGYRSQVWQGKSVLPWLRLVFVPLHPVLLPLDMQCLEVQEENIRKEEL